MTSENGDAVSFSGHKRGTELVAFQVLRRDQRPNRGGATDYLDSSVDSPDQADQCEELTYVDIDTMLESFESPDWSRSSRNL